MSLEDAAVYDDDGEFAGYLFEAPDGSRALVDGDGEVLVAADANGNELDPDTIELADADDEDDDEAYEDQAQELSDRMTALEDYAATPPEPLVIEAQPDDDEQFAAMAGRALEQIEEFRGRPITDAETMRFLADYHADYRAGLDMDPSKSAAIAGIGRDFDRHEDRVSYAVERLEDSARDEDDADYQPGPQPQQPEGYDLDNMDERHAYLADRVSGADVEHLAYRSSDSDEASAAQPYYDMEDE